MSEETRIVEEKRGDEPIAQSEAVAEVTETEAADEVEAVASVALAEPSASADPGADPVDGAASAGPAVAEAVTEAVTEAVAEAVTEAVAEAVTEAVAEDVVAEATSTAPAQEPKTPSAQKPAGEPKTAETDDSRKVVLLSVGQEIRGTVKRTTDFGAFVDIGAGRDGLVHISELSVRRVNKVTDVVQEGQEVTVWIKKLDRQRNRISLTMISPDTRTIRDLSEGEIIEGTVTRIVPYGAFVDIGVGADALLHVREMSNNYVNKPEDVVQIGEKLDARIISINRRRRRIDLSLKGLREEPEPEPRETEKAQTAPRAAEEDTAADPFEDLEVLSPMELAFKRAMEAEGVQIDTSKPKKRRRRRGKKARSIQAEIIQRTLRTMRD